MSETKLTRISGGVDHGKNSAQSSGAVPVKPILGSLLPPLAAILIFLVACAGVLLWTQQQQRLAERTSFNVSELEKDFQAALDYQIAALSMTLQPIASVPGVKESIKKGDIDHLLARWQPVYEDMQRDYGITHFYFFDADRVCLLRVHKPEKNGDLINRFTALEAERTGEIASGIEIGPLGTFTLRVVQPIYNNDEIIGYIELGKEIEDILQSLETSEDSELVVSIYKEFLDQQQWIAGMHMLGREADWDALPNEVVIYSSQGFPDEFWAQWVDHFTEDHVHGGTEQEFASKGKDWRVSVLPLLDAAGQEVGDLLLMIDITDDIVAFNRLLAPAVSAGAVILGLLLSFVYILLQRSDRGIHASQVELAESEAKFKSLFTNMQNGFALHEMIFDDAGVPVDYIFLDINNAFEQLTTLKGGDIIGRRVTDVIPGIADDLFDWIGKYGEVVLTGKSLAFENYSQPLDRWYSVVAYRPNPGKFAVFLTDITKRIQAERQRTDDMREIERMNKLMMGREARVVEMKKEVNTLLKELDRDVKYRSVE